MYSIMGLASVAPRVHLSRFRAVICRKNKKKPQGKMSNSLLGWLHCSNVYSPRRRRRCPDMCETGRRPVMTHDTVSGTRFGDWGEGEVKLYSQ